MVWSMGLENVQTETSYQLAFLKCEEVDSARFLVFSIKMSSWKFQNNAYAPQALSPPIQVSPQARITKGKSHIHSHKKVSLCYNFYKGWQDCISY